VKRTSEGAIGELAKNNGREVWRREKVWTEGAGDR